MKITKHDKIVRKALSHGKRFVQTCYVFHHLTEDNLVIVSVSKKVDKRAVRRNKYRRWFKSLYQTSSMKGTVFVRISKPPQSYQEVFACWQAFMTFLKKH